VTQLINHNKEEPHPKNKLDSRLNPFPPTIILFYNELE